MANISPLRDGSYEYPPYEWPFGIGNRNDASYTLTELT